MPALITAPLISFDLAELDTLLAGSLAPELRHLVTRLRDRLADYHRLAGTRVSRQELAALHDAIVVPLDQIQAQASLLGASIEPWCHETSRQMAPLREAITGEVTDNLAFDDDMSWDA